MSNRYGGESVGKKLARYTFWNRTKRWLGNRFFTEKHLVLASRDGGDIAVLKGLGVIPQNIVADDADQQAVDECRLKHPGVTILHDDVVHVARRSGRIFASVFLDFCSWPTEESLNAIWQTTLFGLRDGAVLGYAFQRGRDGLYDEEREDYEVTYLGHTAVIPIESSFDREFLRMRSLVAASRHLDDAFPGQAHQLLNVTPGRLAAWRAHDTRGTYSAATR